MIKKLTGKFHYIKLGKSTDYFIFCAIKLFGYSDATDPSCEYFRGVFKFWVYGIKNEFTSILSSRMTARLAFS